VNEQLKCPKCHGVSNVDLLWLLCILNSVVLKQISAIALQLSFPRLHMRVCVRVCACALIVLSLTNTRMITTVTAPSPVSPSFPYLNHTFRTSL